MKVGPIEFIFRRDVLPHVQVMQKHDPLMKDPELAAAFAVPDTDPMWRAVLQVIDTARAAAHAGAEEMSGSNNQVCAYSAAGAAHLTMLRKTITDLREQSLNRRD